MEHLGLLIVFIIAKILFILLYSLLVAIHLGPTSAMRLTYQRTSLLRMSLPTEGTM